ncbi:hypothetical protein GCM10010112_23730 [Actinoplanes lobatus]|uniref:Tetratricopeptide (TPR) repeat protein n=1 Tax=Actinoplanes lobatus TaxID=113568 RepID=A0A7W7HIZ5_9ACTN|nr:hypothetical protein [Actinoplanes lobatus]MBB4751415.1 tetratricopeptide (TPR) repeat protein [Actinoplanes lobatus]GGN63984.1 hypothetical protein GCM10010112_23730 [Actinoplanes lobatus]GIE41024.1 hypothetical protein Alo02nite_39220 [Actinoplanes lobatus]
MTASRRLARARALTDRAEQLARSLDASPWGPRYLVAVTCAWTRLGDLERATATATAAGARAGANDPLHHLAMANAYARVGALDRVRRHMRRARKLIPTIEHASLAMIAQVELATIITFLGHLGPAEELARSLPDPLARIRALLSLAQCAQLDQPPSVVEPHDAARLTDEAAQLTRDTPSLEDPVTVRMLIGYTLLGQDRVADALEVAEEAALLLPDLSADQQPDGYAHVAAMFSHLDATERAMELAGRAEPLIAAATNDNIRGSAQRFLVAAYARTGAQNRARHLLSSMDDRFWRRHAMVELAAALADDGDFRLAERIVSTFSHTDPPSLAPSGQVDAYLRIVDSLLSPGPAEHEDTSTPMQRIAILGCGGAGKSHLARQLADRLGLPVTHLDDRYYDDDWNPAPAGEFAATQRDLVAADWWIIDGNYASTLPIRLTRADTVILLDLPAHTCLWGIARRRGRHRITLPFLRYVIRYRRTMRPRVEALIAEHGRDARYLRFTSHRQVNRFLAAL